MSKRSSMTLKEIHSRLTRRCAIGIFRYRRLMRSYARLQMYSHSLRLYILSSRNSLLPDSHTLPLALKSLSSLSLRCSLFSQLLSLATRLGLAAHPHCHCAFVAASLAAGRVEVACKMFDESPQPNVASWNAFISGFSRNHPAHALLLFSQMRRRGVVPDDVTMVTVASACARMGDLHVALQLHKVAFQVSRNPRRPLRVLSMLQNSILDMYAKCGRMDLACKVFNRIPRRLRNVSTWSALVTGYAVLGRADEAIECFRRMADVERIPPNHVTFVGVLTACVHAGRVEEGRRYFDVMRRVHGIAPTLKHYGCMVDLMARGGLLLEAREVVESMPMRPNEVIYGCLMGACEKYGDAEIGAWVADRLVELRPLDDGALVVLSNIYAARGMWSDVERVRRRIQLMGLSRSSGGSIVSSGSWDPESVFQLD